MPFTGSAPTLKQFIVTNMYNQGLMNVNDPPESQDNLMKLATALSDACEQWILASGTSSIVGTIAPGQMVVGAGGGVPGPMTGSTTSSGIIANGNLI
jgi:hypothetical protein